MRNNILNIGSDIMIIAFTGAGISKDSGIPTFEDMEKNVSDGELTIRDKLTRSWADKNPEEFNEIIKSMTESFSSAQPNDAHIALAEYNIPIMTMNIDGLHEKAGSKNIIYMHGKLPNIVLYEDPAPNYQRAMEWVDLLRPEDIFLIIGTSFYTNISISLKIMARGTGARVVVINKNATENVRAFLNNNKNAIESYEDFMKRVEN